MTKGLEGFLKQLTVLEKRVLAVTSDVNPPNATDISKYASLKAEVDAELKDCMQVHTSPGNRSFCQPPLSWTRDLRTGLFSASALLDTTAAAFSTQAHAHSVQSTGENLWV
jgi:hypothetical protein